MNNIIVSKKAAIISRPVLIILGICCSALVAISFISRQNGEPSTDQEVATQSNEILISQSNYLESPPPQDQFQKSKGQFPTIQTSYMAETEPNLTNSFSSGVDSTSYSSSRRISGSINRFEQKIIDLWGNDLKAELLDAQGDQIQVSISKQGQFQPLMIVNRPKSVVEFNGPSELQSSWTKAIEAMDQSISTTGSLDYSVELVGMKPSDASFVRTAVAMMETTVGGSFQTQDQPNRPPTIIGSTQENQIIQDVEGLKGPVTIQVIESLNIIVLRGDAEDVAKVKAVIERITLDAAGNAPSIDDVLLQNSNSTRLKSQVEQAYREMYEPTVGPVNITALSEPDRLLIIGQSAAIDAVKTLIERLDIAPQTTDAGPGFKRISLKYMSSVDAVNRLTTYFQTVDVGAEDTTPREPVSVVGDYRSNSIVVKGSQRSIAIATELIDGWDVDTSDAANEVRVIKLRNAVAGDLQVALQDAINGQLDGSGRGFTNSQNGANQGFQNQFNEQAQAHIRSTVLQLRSIGPNGEQVTNSGIMYDVRITAESNSNSLIVSAPTNSIDLIEQLIHQLDAIPDAETLIKVFTIVNGDATTLLQMFQTLFGTQNAAGGGGLGQTTNLSNLPLQNASATAGGSLVDLRFSVEPRTNSIIVSGSEGDLIVVEDLLTRLDESVRNRLVNHVYRLSNAPADDVATAINTWLDSRRDYNDIDPNAASIPNELARREVIVTPEIVSNSLLVSATPEYFDEIERIIRSIDRRPPMVQIKVLIAEVTLRDIEEFGVEFGVQDSLLFDRGIGTIGYPFNQSGIGNNSDALSLGTREQVAGQGLANFGVGRINNTLGYGGLVLSAGNESINVLIRALQDKNRLRVLGSPHITTVDNLQASITVGEQVPRITNSTQTGFGGTNNTVDFVTVGVILQVTPRVSPDGMIIMEIDAQKSSVGAESEGIPISITDSGEVIRSPRIPTTQAQTTIMSRSGQSVAFSGLITTENSYSKRGVPFLSDLPLVGDFFGFESETCRRTELLIIMTPYLVDSQEQLDQINQSEVDRMNWCLSDVADVYGNISSIHGSEVLDQNTPTVFYPDSDPFGLQPKNTPAYKVLEGGFQPSAGEDLYKYAPGQATGPNEVLPPEYLQEQYGQPLGQNNQWRDSATPVATYGPNE